MAGLVSIIKQQCYDDIISFKEFNIPYFNSRDYMIRLYISVLKESYGKEFNSSHESFVISQFDKLFVDHDINTKDEKNNTYLHEVCNKTKMDEYQLCPLLYMYFISKGLNPTDKNKQGQTCFDYLNDMIINKKRY